MFKKLKDKITEEVKIPSTKFTQSMQQLAQAVVSPSSNNNNASFDHASNDNFSIGGDFDDTPQNSPVKNTSKNEGGGVAYRGGVATPLGALKDTGSAAGFTLVDLQQDSTPQKPPPSVASGNLNDALSNLRRSSVSSSTSDSSFMFPALDSSGPNYNFQSDLESCSEASESVGPNINKEQLLQAYQKIQQRYQKYKGRYVDLARHYRELERENSKAKNILAECQDKALRRMSELKEQCLLEKQAKAHLEEALRSDLEEKDHLIHTLETKIKLLKSSVVDQSPQGEQTSSTSGISETSTEVSPMHSGQDDLLSAVGDSGTSGFALAPEPITTEVESALKEKVKKLEVLLVKCREDITGKCEYIKILECDKQTASTKIETLEEQLAIVKKCEEEASLSLAKNKLDIHRELESKEEEIKKLHAQLSSAASRITDLQNEIILIKEASKKDLIAGKLEATRLIQAEMQQIIINSQDLEERLSTRNSEVAAKDIAIAEFKQQLRNTEQELSLLKHEKQESEDKSQENIHMLKNELSHLQNSLKSTDSKKIVCQLKPILESLQELRKVSCDLESFAVSTVSEVQDLSKGAFEQIISTVSRVSSENMKELEKLSVERDSIRQELENVKTLMQVEKDKFASLEKSATKEKSELAARVLNLEEASRELQKVNEETEVQVSSLKEQLSLEKFSEEQAKQKLLDLEHLLSKEQEKSQGVPALEIKIENLSQKLKASEQIREQLENDFNLQEVKIKSECFELKKQIAILDEALAEKDACLSKVQHSLSELEISAHSEQEAFQQIRLQLEADLQSQKATASALENKIVDLVDQLKVSKANAAQHSEVLEEISSLEKKLSDMEEKASSFISENKTLSMQLEERCRLNQEQEATVSELHNIKESLLESLEKLKIELEHKSSQLEELRIISKTQEEKMSESSDISGMLKSIQVELNMKTKNCVELEEDIQKLRASLINKDESLSLKTNELTNLSHQLEKLSLENTEQKCCIDNLMKNLSIQTNSLKAKSEECTELESKLSQFKEGQLQENIAIKEFQEDFANLKKEKNELSVALSSKTSEIDLLMNKLSSVQENLLLESKLLKEKTDDYNQLVLKLDSLTAHNDSLNELLRQKISECDEKEDQLDNLADEMKRVEELSQELHRINDDRDANVEVLSSEASSLAQKVEELTITTQEMKEREVKLLAKIQVAEELEEEYLTLKEKELELSSKVEKIKNLETEVQYQREQLISKSKLLKELEDENQKLREAGKDLDELVVRAKDAEAKCLQLQKDGANLNSRIQEAAKSEIKWSVLEEELKTARGENAQLRSALEGANENSAVTHTDSKQKGKPDYSGAQPVNEELCIAKNFADLTEEIADNAGEETVTDGEKMWENKYNRLFEEHKMAMLKNAEAMEKLKGEFDFYSEQTDLKLKQRLWDRQGDESQSHEERNNTSFVNVERLQQQLATTTSQLKETKRQHRQEVSDLRRILLNHGSGNSNSVSRSDNLEDATELEYLRNILFEYMMGKEPLVLARVIAAVVKFDSDQTQKILQKEQQRLTLLGQLGIS